MRVYLWTTRDAYDVFVSSRPEIDVLHLNRPRTHQVSLHDEDDNQDHVIDRVNTDSETRQQRRVNKKLVIDTTSETAGGM